MKKELVVAVIDSGVNINDKIIRNYDINQLYYDRREFKPCRMGRKNQHGTEIIKVLLREASNVRVISLQTLQENNRCTLSMIIDSIKYCIRIGVDVINLSLGSCVSETERMKELRQVCNRATESGIVVFAADHNIPDRRAYPANFDNVISVTTPEGAQEYCTVRYKNRKVEFSENYVFVPDVSRCIIRQGNSYLCPLLVGIFCRFIEGREVGEEAVLDYMDFLKEFSRRDNVSRIYFDKKNEMDLEYMRNKRICFFADEDSFNNQNLFDYYRLGNEVEWSYKQVFTENWTQITAYLQQFDVFHFGILTNVFQQEQEAFIKRLLDLLKETNIDVVTVLPILNTFDRIEWTQTGNPVMKSYYK